MASYVVLFRFTTKGAEDIKSGSKRVEKAKQIFSKLGAQVTAFYALMGQYDTMVIVNAPDDETIIKACLAVASLGNVRTETLRAFTEAEYSRMISELP